MLPYQDKEKEDYVRERDMVADRELSCWGGG